MALTRFSFSAVLRLAMGAARVAMSDSLSRRASRIAPTWFLGRERHIALDIDDGVVLVFFVYDLCCFPDSVAS